MKVFIIRGDIIRGRRKTTRALMVVGSLPEVLEMVPRYTRPGSLENVRYQPEDVPEEKEALLKWMNKFTVGTPEEMFDD